MISSNLNIYITNLSVHFKFHWWFKLPIYMAISSYTMGCLRPKELIIISKYFTNTNTNTSWREKGLCQPKHFCLNVWEVVETVDKRSMIQSHFKPQQQLGFLLYSMLLTNKTTATFFLLLSTLILLTSFCFDA